MTELELRNKVVAQAQSWIGCKESDGSHKKIIDLYNSHKPLARGYPVKYTDAWCSTFASAVAIACGLTDIIPTECGCEKHIELFKKLDSWQENENYVPKPGDYVFYDWQDGTNYATTDNKGSADHVGIVEKVSGNSFTVIEGNMSNAVGRRNMQVNGRYLRGFGLPKYAQKAASGGTVTPSTPSTPAKPSTSATFAIDEIVQFNGGNHYTNAQAASGSPAKPGPAKVTGLAINSKHEYHVVHTDGTSNVYGWVDASTLSKLGGTTADTSELKVGDKVKMDEAATVYGKTTKFSTWVYGATLYVREIKDNRVVVSTKQSGEVTGAVHKKYLTKV